MATPPTRDLTHGVPCDPGHGATTSRCAASGDLEGAEHRLEALHDLHFWTLTSGLHSASVHIRASASGSRDDILQAVQRLLREEAGVDHATIQVENASDAPCHDSTRSHA